ncbi:MAG: hemerythrin domain-containing protein [Burkholderiales bacterium]|nr:hemerythrin domain-containing protein [Burkholderiales bacterium]
MAIDPFAQTAPNFDDPLGVLRACHRRIERQLATLRRLRKHLPAHHADNDARSAAAAILRYFDSAARNHHADEELSLFPRLAAAWPPEGGKLAATLASEHIELDRRWFRLRPLLAAIVGRGNAYLPVKEVEDFCAAYEAHIGREEAQVLPRARAVLDAATLATIGAEMAERRDL